MSQGNICNSVRNADWKVPCGLAGFTKAVLARKEGRCAQEVAAQSNMNLKPFPTDATLRISVVGFEA